MKSQRKQKTEHKIKCGIVDDIIGQEYFTGTKKKQIINRNALKIIRSSFEMFMFQSTSVGIPFVPKHRLLLIEIYQNKRKKNATLFMEQMAKPDG